MSFNLQVTPRLGYLHIVVTGQLSKANVIGYIDQVRAECEKRKCSYVLLEDRLAGPRLKLREVIDLALHVRRWAMTVTVAYVYEHAGFVAARLAEAISLLRGFHVGAFASVAEAEAWLLKIS